MRNASGSLWVGCVAAVLNLANAASAAAPSARPRPFLATNGNQVFEVNADGSAYVWGGIGMCSQRNELDAHVLGINVSTAKPVDRQPVALEPTPLAGLPGRVLALEARGCTPAFLVVLEDGSVWVLGRDTGARLGLGLDPSVPAWKKQPVQQVLHATQLPAIRNAIDVRLGAGHALALLRDGTVLGWGTAATGPAAVFDPISIPGVHDAIAIAAGEQHSLALRANGTGVAWGHTADGQLGDGSYMDRWTPVPVKGVADAVAIATSGNTSYALLADGTVVGWGSNGALSDPALARPYGESGDALKRTHMPIPIRGLPKIKALSVGFHVLAEALDGSVWAWGDDNYGNLGIGTSDLPGPGPFQVHELHAPVAIAASAHTSLALMPDGSVKMWGAFVYKHPVLRALKRSDSSTLPVTVTRVPLRKVGTPVSNSGE